MTLQRVVRDYCLFRELKPRSERQIAAISHVFLTWCGVPDLPIEQFSATAISEFLAAKQRAGASSHYRRSLRNTLRALYRFCRQGMPIEQIRPVRVDPLDNESWTPEEIDRLLAALDELRLTTFERWYWRTLIGAAYFTGLSGIDLHRVERRHVTASGVIPFTRSKTGKRVCVAIPLSLLADIDTTCPKEGPIWPRLVTEEGERLQFAKIVEKAKLKGTFKKLRRSSGTQVELLNPGRGHEHLGNGREIFERHYGDVALLAPKPAAIPGLAAYGEPPPSEPPRAA